MATILSIADIIEVGDASTYLSANFTSRAALYGGTNIKPIPPVQIAFVTDALRWGNEGGLATAASLRSTANYLYWMCGKFQLQAQNIISGAGGGSVSSTASGGDLPYPLDFIVSASSFIVTGASSVTISQFIGYNVEFDRNGIPQYTTNPGDGSTYFSWNRTTGAFALLNGAAQVDEKFRIIPSR
jgi:hypothetical protein